MRIKISHISIASLGLLAGTLGTRFYFHTFPLSQQIESDSDATFDFSKITDPQFRTWMREQNSDPKSLNAFAKECSNIHVGRDNKLVLGGVSSIVQTGDNQYICVGPEIIDGSIFANQAAINTQVNKVIFYKFDSNVNTATVIASADARKLLTYDQKLTMVADAAFREKGGGVMVQRINRNDLSRELDFPLNGVDLGKAKHDIDVIALMLKHEVTIVR